MAQKLSPKAAAAKKARDLAAAKTPYRRKCKAENQRKRREAKKNGVDVSGKDWDHKDGRWETVAANRGNHGNGTRREGRTSNGRRRRRNS